MNSLKIDFRYQFHPFLLKATASCTQSCSIDSGCCVNSSNSPKQRRIVRASQMSNRGFDLTEQNSWFFQRIFKRLTTWKILNFLSGFLNPGLPGRILAGSPGSHTKLNFIHFSDEATEEIISSRGRFCHTFILELSC